jgi:hypothetical protein
MMKMVLNSGAIVSALIGLWVLYVGVVNFGELAFPWNCVVIAFQLFLITLAFAPGVMLIKGYKTKRGQLIFIGIAELVIIALGVLGLMAFCFEKSANNQ